MIKSFFNRLKGGLGKEAAKTADKPRPEALTVVSREVASFAATDQSILA